MALPLGGLAIDWCKRVRRTGPSQILRFHMLMAFNICLQIIKICLNVVNLRKRETDRETEIRDKRQTETDIY